MKPSSNPVELYPEINAFSPIKFLIVTAATSSVGLSLTISFVMPLISETSFGIIISGLINWLIRSTSRKETPSYVTFTALKDRILSVSFFKPVVSRSNTINSRPLLSSSNRTLASDSRFSKDNLLISSSFLPYQHNSYNTSECHNNNNARFNQCWLYHITHWIRIVFFWCSR